MGLSEHFWIWRNYIKPFHVGCVFVAKFPGAMRRHWTHQKKEMAFKLCGQCSKPLLVDDFIWGYTIQYIVTLH